MKAKTKNYSLIVAILLVTFLVAPIKVLADHVELRYVNARQAYIDTFFNKTVAQLIYDESAQHDINPRLILIMIQKESSAVTRSEPSSDTTRAWPLFYNYDERMANCLLLGTDCTDTKYNKPDYAWRAENFGGVGQQIAYATAQLRNLAGDGNPANGNYCEGNNSVSVDGGTIVTANAGSCALYKYTPHYSSYNTGSSFYTNWISWWGGTPNGGDYSSANIISDNNFRNANPLSAAEIESFLNTKGSWMKAYTIPEYISVPYPVLVSDAPPPTERKTGDANRDGNVDLLDLSLIATHWGGNNADADLNSDGTVDLLDLSILAGAWGS